jgi:carbonic anhydrase
LAVLGILLELAEESTNDGTYRNEFVEYLSNVKTNASSYTIPDPKRIKTIKDLIKKNVKNFYSYRGSLTTPP